MKKTRKTTPQPEPVLKPYTSVFCTLGNSLCRHCSEETHTSRRQVPSAKDNVIIETQTIPLGLRCNNACRWVSDLKECPVPVHLRGLKD